MVASTPVRHRARLDALTGLRFWFAFLVVMHHSLTHWFGSGASVVADFGYIGVDFFFVLSGFVLTWSARPGVSCWRFWGNRVARIWPLHLTTLLLAVVLGVGVNGVLPLLANLVLLQAWWPQQHVYFGFNAVSWSLSCEVFFYLCFPLILRGLTQLRHRGRRLVLAGIVVALAIYPGLFSLTVAPRDPAGWEWSTYVLPLWRLGEFVVGILTALAVSEGWRPRLGDRPVSGRVALALATLMAAAYVAIGQFRGGLPDRPLTEVVAMLVVAMVLGAVAADEARGRRGWSSSALMVELGAASYALYLCHALLYGWLVAHWSATGTGMASVAGWSAYVGLAIAVALALHHLVEVPAERWLRHRLGRRAPSTAPVYPPDHDRVLASIGR